MQNFNEPINSLSDNIIEIVPEGYQPGTEKNRPVRIIDPNEDKWDAAFY